MSQVIEVRFIDPAKGKFFDEMVLPSSKTPHDRRHHVAVEMGLDSFCGVQGGIALKEMILADEKFVFAGCNSCYRYIYSCTLESGGKDHEMKAVLFTGQRSPDLVGKKLQKIHQELDAQYQEGEKQVNAL